MISKIIKVHTYSKMRSSMIMDRESDLKSERPEFKSVLGLNDLGASHIISS